MVQHSFQRSTEWDRSAAVNNFFPSYDIVLAWEVAYGIIIFLDGDPFYADNAFNKKVKSYFMLMKVSKTDGFRGGEKDSFRVRIFAHPWTKLLRYTLYDALTFYLSSVFSTYFECS